MKTLLLAIVMLISVSMVVVGAVGNEMMLEKSELWTLEAPKPKLILYREFEKAVDAKEYVDQKLYQAEHNLRHYEGLEEERLQMVQFVEDIKSGKAILNFDHIINAKITKALEKETAKYDNVEIEWARAVIQAESNFIPGATSWTNAQGLMQVMPKTGEWLKLENPYHINENIAAGVKYLSEQMTTFNGHMALATAAYNAGPNAVKAKGRQINKIGGIPQNGETPDYVKRVIKYYNINKGV